MLANQMDSRAFVHPSLFLLTFTLGLSATDDVSVRQRPSPRPALAVEGSPNAASAPPARPGPGALQH